MGAVTDGAVAWLLRSREPAIRGMTRRDLLGEARPNDLRHVLDGPLVRGLLADQKPDGGFGGRPYDKWTGAHWRLVSLVELEIPAGESRAMRALDTVLDWLAKPRRLARRPTTASGLPLSDGSIEGNALAVACRLGAAAGTATRAPPAGARPSTRASFRCGAYGNTPEPPAIVLHAKPRSGPRSYSWSIGSFVHWDPASRSTRP
jgi:hypothetical protein